MDGLDKSKIIEYALKIISKITLTMLRPARDWELLNCIKLTHNFRAKMLLLEGYISNFTCARYYSLNVEFSDFYINQSLAGQTIHL
jgi:hypothetical protein